MAYKNSKDCLEYLKNKYPIAKYLDGKDSEILFISRLIRRFLPNGGRILDLGCGGMDKAAMMALLGYEMHAVDDFGDPWHLQGNNLEKLRQFAKEMNIKLTEQGLDSYKLNYPEYFFDGIMISNVIEHLHESPRDLLNNAGVCLREGGYLFVTMPNSANLRKRLSVLAGKSNYPSAQMFYEWIGKWRGHVREYTLAETEYILGRNGFRVLFSSTYHSMLEKRIKHKFAIFIYKTICRIFPTFRESLATVASKPVGWQIASVDQDALQRHISDLGFISE